MSDRDQIINVEISRNTLIDRLRVLQSELSEENRHSDALLVDFAIQALTQKYPETTGEHHEQQT